MRVEVYADIACAWCRLVTQRFHRAVEAAETLGVELVHRPFQLDPDASATPRPMMETMAELFGPTRAEQVTAEMTRLGATEGVEYRFDRAVSVNTLAAHRLLWFVLRERGPRLQAAVARALFEAHFRDGVNIADPVQLGALVEPLGLERSSTTAFLNSEEGIVEVGAQQAAAKHGGVTAVPTFVFSNGERLAGASGTDELEAALHRADGKPKRVSNDA